MNAELRGTVKQLHASLAERDAELQRATRIASTNAYALGRVQSSIDELGRDLTDSEGAPPQTQASILTRIDGGRNHSFVLRGRTTIGRDPDNDLALETESVSRHHAVLIPAFRSALVQDLGSTNGVLVNRRRVRCARLEHGDVITLGQDAIPLHADAGTGGRRFGKSNTSTSTRESVSFGIPVPATLGRSARDTCAPEFRPPCRGGRRGSSKRSNSWGRLSAGSRVSHVSLRAFHRMSYQLSSWALSFDPYSCSWSLLLILKLGCAGANRGMCG
jgi:pSer/pThr/pTyr-binding forkhead associated (FHA) protein